MEIFSLISAILFTIFTGIAFLGIPVERYVSSGGESSKGYYFTISENYSKSNFLRMTIASLAFVLVFSFPLAIYFYTDCVNPQNRISAGTIAGIAGVMGFSTLVTLKWLKTTSTLHLTMALLAFVLGVVSLWLAADDIDSYILSGTATLGLVIAIAFGSKMVNLHDMFRATQITDQRKSRQITAWVASGELLLLLSIIIYLFFAAFDKRCKTIGT